MTEGRKEKKDVIIKIEKSIVKINREEKKVMTHRPSRDTPDTKKNWEIQKAMNPNRIERRHLPTSINRKILKSLNNVRITTSNACTQKTTNSDPLKKNNNTKKKR